MGSINLLDQKTINKIAAGEVVDRPASVVKELVENAVDAGAKKITVEIRGGGKELVRVTDDGRGIDPSDVKSAFLRHATSKISDENDLFNINTLGFRGEALSSIASVSMVEMITKTQESLSAVRYQIEGGKEISRSEIGAPDGTTIFVRNLFFNTPARRKFLKSDSSETAKICEVCEKQALANPSVSINLISNSKTLLYTSGNGSPRDVIYAIYGREVTSNLLPVLAGNDLISVEGFVAGPLISKGNRSFENYFLNGRFIKNNVIERAIEEAYRSRMMQRQYPFCALYITIENDLLDVNVHPAKLEARIDSPEMIYDLVFEAVSKALAGREVIPRAALGSDEADTIEGERKRELSSLRTPEPFEINRLNNRAAGADPRELVGEDGPVWGNASDGVPVDVSDDTFAGAPAGASADAPDDTIADTPAVQLDAFETGVLKPESRKNFKIIGQVFKTYWIVEFEDNMFIIDQHAAHEKVLYERMMKKYRESGAVPKQRLSPPVIVTLSAAEEELIEKFGDDFNSLGFEIEHFGGREYALRTLPYNIVTLDAREMFFDTLETLIPEMRLNDPEKFADRVATASCKAAVKGNNSLSYAEADALINEMLFLENPYQCPHGRPTIISISKYEMEKKFKRIT